LEHFSLKCPLSKEIWNTAYKTFRLTNSHTTPSTLNDIFTAVNINNSKEKKAAIWLHITVIYEIWCWYTQAKWGNNLISLEAIVNITKHKLKYEFNLIRKLSYSKINSRSKAAKELLNILSALL